MKKLARVWKGKASLVLILITLTLALSVASSAVHAIGVIDRITLGTPGGYYGAAYDSGKGEIFVTNYNDDFVSVISDSTKTVVASVSLPAEGAYASSGIAYDSAKSELFVVSQAGYVFILSDSPNALVETITLGRFSSCLGIAYDAAKGKIIVSNGDNDTVSVLSDSSSMFPFPTPTSVIVVVAVVVVTLCAVAFTVRRLSKTNFQKKKLK